MSRKDGYFLKETNPSKNQSPNKLPSNAYVYAVDYNVLHIGFGYLKANYWQTQGYPELNSKCESLFGFETIPNTIGLNRILN